MSIRKIAKMGEPVLRKKAEKVPIEDIQKEHIQRIIQDMLETVIDAEGAGLAAPQIFESKKIVILRFSSDEDFQVWINPTVTPTSETELLTFEGCLSVPELRGAVPRPASVRVEAYNAFAEPFTLDLEDYPAVVAQHECDHLEGILYIDRVIPQTMAFLKEYRRHQDELWKTILDEE